MSQITAHNSHSSTWLTEKFHRLAQAAARIVGSPWSFATALLLILVWVVSGPVFGFSDTWQLIINTSTTIVTFLMVFLIQNTQNRDARALHLKLDELLRAMKRARTEMVDIEELSEEELERLEGEFRSLRQQCKSNAIGAKSEVVSPG